MLVRSQWLVYTDASTGYEKKKWCMGFKVSSWGRNVACVIEEQVPKAIVARNPNCNAGLNGVGSARTARVAG